MTEERINRKQQPNCHLHEMLQFEHGGFIYTAVVDGRLVEAFLKAAGTVNTTIELNACYAAITAAILFLHGCSPDKLRALTRNGRAGSRLSPLPDLLAANDGDKDERL